MTVSTRNSLNSMLLSLILVVICTTSTSGSTRKTEEFKNTIEGDDHWIGIKMPAISHFAGESVQFFSAVKMFATSI